MRLGDLGRILGGVIGVIGVQVRRVLRQVRGELRGGQEVVVAGGLRVIT
jgi:hypothetical protein